jgi:hypothetical protein
VMLSSAPLGCANWIGNLFAGTKSKRFMLRYVALRAVYNACRDSPRNCTAPECPVSNTASAKNPDAVDVCHGVPSRLTRGHETAALRIGAITMRSTTVLSSLLVASITLVLQAQVPATAPLTPKAPVGVAASSTQHRRGHPSQLRRGEGRHLHAAGPVALQ